MRRYIVVDPTSFREREEEIADVVGRIPCTLNRLRNVLRLLFEGRTKFNPFLDVTGTAVVSSGVVQYDGMRISGWNGLGSDNERVTLVRDDLGCVSFCLSDISGLTIHDQ